MILPTNKVLGGLLLLTFISIAACVNPTEKKTKKPTVNNKQKDSLQESILPKDVLQELDTLNLYTKTDLERFNDSSFIELKRLDTTFVYDMKYASSDNFLKEKVYDCGSCLLRYKTAKELIKVNNEFKKQGLRILFFDCYRPLSVQKKMWNIYPDKRYVANPSQGSNHNRGTAVDITLVNENLDTLAMGTSFDYFGRKAHHAYQKLPDTVLNNRKWLKTTMEKHGFWAITSEWWHYNLNQSYKYGVSNFPITCSED